MVNNIEKSLLYNIISMLTKKSFGRHFTLNNIIKKGDLIDYYIEKLNDSIKINYTYYEKSKNEDKFIINSIVLNNQSSI